MAISYKCPNCAANLLFDPDVKLLSCAFCDAKISPDDIVSQDAADGFLQGGAWEDDTVGMICDNCGAEIISEKNALATFCAFCGAPGIRVCERGGARPSRMIPFTYGREEAEKEFLKWCGTKKFLPRGFTSAGTLKKLTGLYVPFWLMDYMVGVNVTWIDHMEEKNAKGESHTEYYEKRKQGLLVWNKVPVDGAQKIDDILMEGIEPFNYEMLRAYDTKYLAGFYADKYDTSAEKLTRRVFLRVAKYVKEACGPGRVQFTDNSVYYPPAAEYVLLPVWFLNYHYQGKDYAFVLNGQTGKTAGETPLNKFKVTLLSAAVLLVSGALFAAAGILIFGGAF